MTPFGRRPTASDLATLVLWVAAIVLVILPGARVFQKVWAMDPPTAAAERVDPFREWTGAIAAGQTVLWCSVIGIAAATLALIWAWWMRGLGRRGRMWAMGIGLAPMLLPSYLAYAGWNLLRSPGTWLGDALAIAPPRASVWAWRGFAIGGLTLWVWPLALLVLAPACARISQNVLDAMRTDGAPASVRATQVLGMLARDIVRAAALCALVMAGSAIPLHVAQVNTYTIWLWSEMNRVSDPRGMWMAALPALALAFLGAHFLLRLVPATQREAAEQDSREAQPLRRPRAVNLAFTAAACCIWAASVLVPMLLFVLSVREPSAFPGFWRESSHAILNSTHIGLWVGGIGALALLAAWLGTANGSTDSRRQWVPPLVLWLAFAGLVPGVLVGSAFAMTSPFSGVGLVVVTHLARFVFIAAIVGYWLGASETLELRSLRELDGAATLRGWLLACVRPRWGVVLGTALAMLLLSLHEIESTIQVQPPGLDNLAQYLLDQLHQLRQDQLAAAGATMTGIGLVGAILGGILLAKSGATVSERS